MVENASKIVGIAEAKEMLEKEYLGKKADFESSRSINFFTTSYRQEIIYQQMREIVKTYLNINYLFI